MDIMKHANTISPQRGARGRWAGQAQMAENAGDAGGSMGQATQQVRQDGGAGGEPAQSALDGEKKYALAKHHLKLLCKRAGVTRWAQKLCCLLERYLGALPHAQEAGVTDGRERMGLDLDMSGEDVPGLDWDLALAAWCVASRKKCGKSHARRDLEMARVAANTKWPVTMTHLAPSPRPVAPRCCHEMGNPTARENPAHRGATRRFSKIPKMRRCRRRSYT